MLLTPVDYLMNDKQVLRWHDGLSEILSLQRSSSAHDPWLFHGTSQRNARIIAESGFNPRTSYVFVPDFERGNRHGTVQDCVFWSSTMDMARNFAEKKSNSGYHGFPVIFAARASDLSETGRLMPDFNTWDYNTDCDPSFLPTDWRDSITKLAAIAVADCRIVPNLRMFAPDDLDIMPDPQTANTRFAEHLEELYKPGCDEEEPSMVPGM